MNTATSLTSYIPKITDELIIVINQYQKSIKEKINLKGTLGAHKKIKAMSEENVTQVNLIENGPVVVVGAVEVHHPDGSVECRERRSSFCRCGKSSSMPMCDGSHKN